jgi:uncharacterized repeat protein (TIGR03803 family)
LLFESLEQRKLLSVTFTSLASFSVPGGANPQGGVIEDSSGNLFGTTSGGGSSGDGTVFEINAGSGALTTLVSFNGTNGANPEAGVIEDSSGNLFGTTNGGGSSRDGTVFEIKAGSNDVTTLASFNGTEGEYPLGGVVEDSSGNLFGTTAWSGSSGQGTVFEIQPGSKAVTTLASFNGTNGSEPTAGVVEDSSGNLFGTTFQGGSSNDGTLFEIKAGTNAVTTLVSFNATTGANPDAGVVEDSSGNLFGTTDNGGANGDGTVFEIKAGSNAVTTIVSFNGTNGEYPDAGVVEDSSGNLFGTTGSGGPSDDGTVFEIQAGSGAVTTLASFNVANGSYPDGGLFEDSGGNLFGTTYEGGPRGEGTVFQIQPGSNAVTTLTYFGNTEGGLPYGDLVEGSNGNLFGTNSSSGSGGDGTVFEITAGSNAVTTLASFNGSDGMCPYAGLVEDSSGNLFGTTGSGGPSDDGTVFEIKAGSDAVTTLASFNGSNGANPNAGLIEDSSGNLKWTRLSRPRNAIS